MRCAANSPDHLAFIHLDPSAWCSTGATPCFAWPTEPVLCSSRPGAAVLQFDLRNGSIRKKYDSLKYTLRKLENTLYELSLAEAGYKRQEDEDRVRATWHSFGLHATMQRVHRRCLFDGATV